MKGRHTARAVRRRVGAAAAVAAAAALLAGYGGVAGATKATSASAHDAASRGGTLVVAPFAPNQSLNPALANTGTDVYYLDPLYDSLIRIGPGGTLEPDLATSWGYVGTGNKTFTFTLRSGVEFSNGSPLTAKDAAASIRYFENHTGNSGYQLKDCPDITATGPLTVQIVCTTSYPVLPLILSDFSLAGDIICSYGLTHPSTLATTPCGAGEYTLDASETVTGSTYTYVANPHYWDPSAINYHKIVVKFIPDQNSALAALQAGQVDAIYTVSSSIEESAQSSGDNVTGTPLPFQGILLADRAPGSNNPLASLDVRRALNYAVDRTAMIKGIYGKWGKATDEIGIPGQPTTFDPAFNNYYPYNPTEATTLLKEAGYGSGFTLNVVTNPQNATPTQAIAGYWNAIGVKTNITTDPTAAAYASDAVSGNYPAIGIGYAAAPMFLEAMNFFEPVANEYNPFKTADPTALKLVKEAAAASGATQLKLYRDLEDFGVKEAWWVVSDYFDVGQVLGSNVTAPPLTNGDFIGNDIDITAK